MSNSYTKAAFGIVVTSPEADLLRRVIGAIELVGDVEIGLEALKAHFHGMGEDFAALFPRTAESPFDGLLDLFPDENFPILDFEIDFGEADADGRVALFFSGEQFGVETAAKLIQRCAQSALPFGFEWASDCDRLRAGEFGGGYVAISHAAVARQAQTPHPQRPSRPDAARHSPPKRHPARVDPPTLPKDEEDRPDGAEVALVGAALARLTRPNGRGEERVRKGVRTRGSSELSQGDDP